MSAANQVTIVIPVRNGRRFLAACLEALLAEATAASELVTQIVAVDNDSLDGSADWLAAHFPQVLLVRNQVNRGFAGGCNDGLTAAPAEISILLNQDTVVAPGWLRAVVAAFADPAVGVVGCKILYPDGQTLQHAGGYIQRPQQFGRHYSQHERDVGQADGSRPVEWVTGAALAIHRRVIEQVGLLDEGFWPGYFEDMDYCLRVRAAGWQVWYCAEALLAHQETSSQIDFESLQRFYHRGRLRFALKHLPRPQLLDEFFAAERDDGARPTPARQTAYWQTLSAAPALLRQHQGVDEEYVAQVLTALRGLIYAPIPLYLVWEEQALQPFREFTFPSDLPWLGALLSGVRRLWYNVAARWGVLDLSLQQNRVNRQLVEQIRMLERNGEALQYQLDQLALANAGLVQQLNQLQADRSAKQNSPPPANEEA